MKVFPSNAIEEGWDGLDAGPKSRVKFANAIKGAKTILWNGPAGCFECDDFTAGSKAIGVNPNCQNQKVAVSLAQYLASEEAQKAHYEMRGIIPCNTTLLATDALQKDALAQAQSNTMANTAIIQPNNKTFGDNWWNNATTMANAIMDGTVTEANAADETAKFENAINGR